VTLWLVTVPGTAEPPRSRPLDDEPAPCVLAHGIGGVAHNQWWIERSATDPLDRLTPTEARAAANRVNRRAP
jgi:hypothetical protein